MSAERIEKALRRAAYLRERGGALVLAGDGANIVALEAALREAQAKVDCGGINCGECQECLRANFHFARQALRESQAERRGMIDQLTEAQAENALLKAAVLDPADEAKR